jgi:hypothetical protein
MMTIFSGAHDFSVSELEVVNIIPPIIDPLNGELSSSGSLVGLRFNLPPFVAELASHIAAGALHDSDERCDAPKCHPETRVAVRDEIYSWIVHGDPVPEQKMVNIKWVTGPAGTGKSAIMGSLADTCKENGVLTVTYFFPSSAPPQRRTKGAFIPTLAYQLAQYLPGFKDAMAHSMQHDPLLFKKNLRAQMEAFVLIPLRRVADKSARPGVVLVDGIDACEAGQYYDTHAPSSRGPKGRRTKDEDQLEILQVLREASLDPAFPFRIVIASRPERVFRQFFNGSPFVPPLVLDEKYNPDADIAFFLQSKFREIRRQYNLRPSWPSPEVLATLLAKASGQFIYVATVIRYITTSRQGNPQTLLDQVLKVKPICSRANPFSHLDAFYIHILQSSPDPALAVKWLWTIKGKSPSGRGLFIVYNGDRVDTAPACYMNMFLQANDGDAEHVLGDLHSLIGIPPPHDLASPYRPHHMSLMDFLCDEDRCGSLYVNDVQHAEFLGERFLEICMREYIFIDMVILLLTPPITDRGSPTGCPSDPAVFMTLFNRYRPPELLTLSRLKFTPSSVEWWVSTSIEVNSSLAINHMFHNVHRRVCIAATPSLRDNTLLMTFFDSAVGNSAAQHVNCGNHPSCVNVRRLSGNQY